MNQSEAKNLVIRAGRELVSSGLIARTWGNVSCRVSEELFVITPSGRNYLDLTEEEIVPVRVSDLSFEGDIAPSSEKRLHAAVYKMNPRAGFIVHTHQDNASVLSALGIPSVPVPAAYAEELGSEVPCAAYGLPGTKTLARNTVEALKRSKGNAAVMKRHGVLCVGEAYEDAFHTASVLEEVCGGWLKQLFAADNSAAKVVPCGFTSSRRADKGRRTNEDQFTGEGRRTDGGFFLTLTGGGEQLVPWGGTVPGLEKECALCNRVYAEHPDINFIESTADESVRYALNSSVLLPWLDDFAQLIGTRLTVLPPEAGAVSRSLKKVSAALIRNMGGLCFGSTETDASAVRLLLEKNCRAFRAAELYRSAPAFSRSAGGQKKRQPSALSGLDSALMRYKYLTSYSKKY